MKTLFVTRSLMRSRAFAGCVSLLAAFLFSSGALAADEFAAVPEVLQQLVNSNEIPGAVALVATKDKVLHLSAVGQSDLATGRKMKTDDVFWIASMSKPMTSVAVAMLADDGKLSFDEPLQFTQDADGLKVWFPSEKPCDYVYALKITGLKLA